MIGTGMTRPKALFLILTVALVVPVLFSAPKGSDLFALWMAGKAFAMDRPDLIYAQGDLFTLLPPAEWAPIAAAEGFSGVLFPYLYPPLWAALMAPVTGWLDFRTFVLILHAANLALLAATFWLAWRATGRTLPLAAYMVAATAAVMGTFIGMIAMAELQVQILVAFLCILCVERLRAGAELSAGAALALAASLKLFPALLVVLLIARGRMHAAASFAVTGGVLGGLSILLAGWPLHAEMFRVLGAVSSTIVAIPVSFSIDGILGFLFQDLALVSSARTPDIDATIAGALIGAKGALWSRLSLFALVATLAAGVWLARRPAAPEALAWGATMVLVALVSPLGWSHYFIAPAALAPALIPALGWRAPALALAPLAWPLVGAWNLAIPGLPLQAMIGFAAMAALAMLFARAILRARTDRGRAAAPTRSTAAPCDA
ncbi:DUF2029 domain-containing protein [Palleronia sediminis]|uniref:DUF2029 domain-containing protein n=1 Tax=Palleronia sediminis TaxID=2547833 RepID=A0A4R6A0H4_9RHOB|nr:glycosyltransferase family 87 protein [Palleronia sediminis]TDL76044.1 DUF2029 domain-containing protein [Palleronia sediminis]